MLKGYGKVGLRLDSRLPKLTLHILHQLIQAVIFLGYCRHADGPVAQLVEQRFALREVVSSTLAGPTLRVLK